MGRERELADLKGGLADAGAGRGRLFLIAGEPGIGKTRLAEEFAGFAGAHDAVVFRGRCWEGGGAPAYWPWMQAIRSFIRQREPQDLSIELGSGASYVAQVVPEVREKLTDLREPVASFESEHARFYLFDSIAGFLRNISARKPLVLVLEDLHFADQPSLLLLEFLEQELVDSRVLMVGTYRDAEITQTSEKAERFSALRRDAHHLHLGGLSEAEVARLVEQTAEAAPPEALVRTLHQTTEGNPLFVQEITRKLVSDGQLGGARTEWRLPGEVRQAIRRRLGPLPAEAHDVLSVASVMGREFTVAVLAAVCGRPLEQVHDALDRAIAEGIVGEGARSLGQYRFSHALFRETFYEDLAANRRLGLHREIGEAIERLYANDLEAYVTTLAHHFSEAATLGSAEKAVDYSMKAAAQAAAKLAYEEAASHCERALDALGLGGKTEDGRRCELLLALGNARRSAGSLPQAQSAFDQAAELARKARAPDLMARAALGFLQSLSLFGTPLPNDSTDGVRLAREALSRLGEEDSPIRAKLLSELALATYWSEMPERTSSIAKAAIDMARRLGDPATLAQTLSRGHWACWVPEKLEERLQLATELVELGGQVQDEEMALQGRVWRAIALFEEGSTREAETEFRAFFQLAQKLRQPSHLWYAVAFRAMFALVEGRFEEAERLGEKALEIGSRTGVRDAGDVYSGHTILLRRDLGRLQDFEAMLTALVESTPGVAAARAGLALFCCEIGREAAGRRLFDEIAANHFEDIPRNFAWLVCMSLLAEACASLRDRTRAAKLYELLSPCAGRNIVSVAATFHGCASRLLGLLAVTLSRWDDAAKHFETALAMNAKTRALPELARTQWSYGAMLVRRGAPGDREKAAALFAQSLEIAGELAMKGLEEKVLAAQAELSVEPTTNVPSSTGPAVFRREGEFWMIGYEGKNLRLKDRKGFHFLAQLLRRPGEEIFVGELLAGLYGGAEDSSNGAARAMKRLPLFSDAGRMLDDKAKDAYRDRLRFLREELEEAEAANDRGRVARTEQEIDALEGELTRSLGLGGRNRRAGSVSERARTAVTNAIRRAIEAIGEEDPSLGRHLESSVKTGLFLGYVPTSEAPSRWKF